MATQKPNYYRQLNYWLVSDLSQDDVPKVHILTAIKMEHHAVTLEIDSLDDQQHGPSLWKFNSSVLDDILFVEHLRKNFPNCQHETNFCDDFRIKWDWIKYKICEESIRYSKLKAKEMRNRTQIIENRFKLCENY